ncbi:MAG: DUF1361 domain-containing protein [Erysipelotrichaceae bacterium]|nr:DUF1361 domain-containing protein [Erysipelotrichaceae bacterium]
MRKNLKLFALLIIVLFIYAGCGIAINHYGGSLYLSWLFWNLFLAVLPVFFALGAQMLLHWNLFTIGLSVLWLLFLPNACYMVTDLIYLDSSSFVGSQDIYLQNLSAWIELFYIASGVFFAMVSGLFSTYLITQKLHFKSYLLRLLWIVLISLLCGYGVYIGRFLRLNSWDILHPFSLFQKLLENINAFTIIFTCMIAVFYFTAYIIFETMMTSHHENQSIG